jgi:hypothetical protein
MDIATIAIAVLQSLPALIAAGQDVVSLIENTVQVIGKAQAAGTDPTPEEWAALDAKINQLRSQI